MLTIKNSFKKFVKENPKSELAVAVNSGLWAEGGLLKIREIC